MRYSAQEHYNLAEKAYDAASYWASQDDAKAAAWQTASFLDVISHALMGILSMLIEAGEDDPR